MNRLHRFAPDGPQLVCGFQAEFWGKWILTLLIGPVMGVIAFALEELSSKLWEWRQDALHHPSGGAGFHGWFGFTLWNLMLALVAYILVFTSGSASAGGSGIPEVRRN